MKSAVVIDRISPNGAIPPVVASSSKHIVRRRQVEIVPESNTNYSFLTNSQVVFDINSPTDFCNLADSYIRFNLTTALNNNGVAVVNRYLSEGGVHSFWRQITVETGDGTLIAKMDRYNKDYAVLSRALFSKDHINSELWRSGDSVDFSVQNIPNGQPILRSITGSAFALAAQTLTITGGLATQELQVGDLIRLADADQCDWGRVASITNDTTVVLDGLASGAAPAAPGTPLQVQVIRESVIRGQAPARTLFATTSGIQCNFQPFVPFLMLKEWIPLFLMRAGLRITLTLDRPEYCICAPVAPVGTGFSGADIQLSNLVYVCDMIEPDQELMKAYVDMYKTQGIAYPFISMRHFLDTCGSGALTNSTTINANTRSTRYIIQYIQNARGETVRGATGDPCNSTYTCDSVAQGLCAGLRYIQYQAGSETFPFGRPLDLGASGSLPSANVRSNAEVLAQVQKVFGQNSDQYVAKRFYPHEFGCVRSFTKEYETGAVVDASRFLIAMDLGRDSQSVFSGLDLSLAPLQCQLEFDTSYSMFNKDNSAISPALGESDKLRYIHTCLAFDSVFLLSSSEMVVYS